MFDYSGGFGNGCVLTCHLCPEGKKQHYADLMPPENDAAREAVRNWVTRHHRKQHPEKLFVLTTTGWMSVEQLEPRGLRGWVKAAQDWAKQTPNFPHS